MITNTRIHFGIGMLIGLWSLVLRQLNLQGMVIISCFAFFVGTIAFELAQRAASTDPNYLNKKLLDSFLDILAGNAGFNIVFWSLITAQGWWA